MGGQDPVELGRKYCLTYKKYDAITNGTVAWFPQRFGAKDGSVYIVAAGGWSTLRLGN